MDDPRRQNPPSMSFPFGRPIFAMIVCSLLAGGALLFRNAQPKTDLTLWVFADLHARMYRGDAGSPALLDEFQQRTGKSVRLDLIAAPALDVRLLSMFMFSQGKKAIPDSAFPDLVELPLESIGKYFRPPVEEVGFLPLNDYLSKSGWGDRIVKSRFSPWSKDGVIFGVPHDLNPCSLTYRKDLFDVAGVDLESAQTWEEFQNRCLKFQQYWQDHGHPRTAMGLSTAAATMLMVMLRQQHVELVDADLALHLSDPKVAATLCWYARAVAGPRRIGADLNPSAGQSAADVSSGDICALITPDWMVADLKQYGPDLSGKLHMIPLPRFSSDDARTASWGGTMIGITRTCKDPDLAWKLIESLYLEPGAIRARQKSSGILPPIPAYWSDPVYQKGDAFYGGQKIDQLYIELAGELPEAKMTAYTMQAQTFLSIVLNRAVAKVRSSGDAGLEAACQLWLADVQAQVAAMIRFNK
jgi:arabinosaccharide transport system substrate-binding protein